MWRCPSLSLERNQCSPSYRYPSLHLSFFACLGLFVIFLPYSKKTINMFLVKWNCQFNCHGPQSGHILIDCKHQNIKLDGIMKSDPLCLDVMEKLLTVHCPTTCRGMRALNHSSVAELHERAKWILCQPVFSQSQDTPYRTPEMEWQQAENSCIICDGGEPVGLVVGTLFWRPDSDR